MGNVQILQSYDATLYCHPIQTKNNVIIFVVQILPRELYMHDLIFSNWTLRYHGNGRTFAFKTCETQTSMVYINFPKI